MASSWTVLCKAQILDALSPAGSSTDSSWSIKTYIAANLSRDCAFFLARQGDKPMMNFPHDGEAHCASSEAALNVTYGFSGSWWQTLSEKKQYNIRGPITTLDRKATILPTRFACSSSQFLILPNKSCTIIDSFKRVKKKIILRSVVLPNHPFLYPLFFLDQAVDPFILCYHKPSPLIISKASSNVARPYTSTSPSITTTTTFRGHQVQVIPSVFKNYIKMQIQHTSLTVCVIVAAMIGTAMAVPTSVSVASETRYVVFLHSNSPTSHTNRNDDQ